jgi:hypothetical protein
LHGEVCFGLGFLLLDEKQAVPETLYGILERLLLLPILLVERRLEFLFPLVLVSKCWLLDVLR